MTDDQHTYLAVLKAAFDYDPQPDAEDEIPIKENQVIFLLERVDEDWWKVKVKQDEDGSVGLVPSTYLETQEHVSVVKAQYDYDAQQPGELTVKEGEILYVYDKDDAWLLVHSQKTGGRVGFVPENYVEEISEGSEDATAAPEAPPVSQIIVPPSPPRPSAPYVEPEVLVAATANKFKADNIQTWAVSEIDKKGKKKKGTLGVGNGTVFFASESDKTPVQQWQSSFLQSAHIDKAKHVMMEVGGPSPINLHFHAGSKDNAEAIIAKLRLSKELSSSSSEPAAAAVADVPERPRSAAKSVHFDAAPAFIPPREPSEDGEEEDLHPNAAVVLYDFTADGDDELNVQQGESLIVLDWDADDWWKVRNLEGLEGVVPANYVELNPAAVSRRETEAQGAQKSAEEKAAAERRAEDVAAAAAAKQQQKEAAAQRAKVAAAAAEADKKRRDAERAAQEKVAEEQRDRDRNERELARRVAANEISSPGERRSSSNGKPSTSSNSASRGPPPDSTRVWHDRSGQFRVEAKFLGFSNGKLRLHKTNGVVIEVPSEKMSPEDIRYVEKLTNKGDSTQTSPTSRVSDEDETLASRRRSLREDSKPPAKKGPQTDWFDFFLSAGCDVDDCTRYASSFERDKIDESILPDITEGTMRSLGLREGDIIRVKKEIDKRNPKEQSKPTNENPAPTILVGPTPPPNLFAEPNGILKNNTQRRGRPTPSKALPAGNVDITAISSASEQIQKTNSSRTGSPLLINPGPPIQPPPRSSSVALSAPSGFDDDAWTNRPSSARPSTQTPPIAPITVRAPSAPPIAVTTSAPPPAPAPAIPTVSVQSATTQLQSQPTGGKILAQTTESDVFEQLARLSQMRVQSPAVSPPAASRLNGSLAPVVSPPPRTFSSMGMGPSPVPMGNLQANLHVQSSAALQQQNGPGGPFAPVPANQPLLQPLIPTTTGFTGFVPTRPTSNSSSFQPQQQNFLSSQPTGFPGPAMSNSTGFQLPLSQQGPLQPAGVQTSNFFPSGFQSRMQSPPAGFQSQPTGFQPQPTGFQPQPTGFQPQPTGFQPQPTGFQPQPTGFQPQPPGFQLQPTGFQPSGNTMFQPTGAQGTNSFGSPPFQTTNSSFGQVQPNPTGFNAGGFGQSPFGNHMAVPPVPPLPQSNFNSNNTTPANVFAQMKAGTFADNESVAQPAANYDALRPNPMAVQATGWNPGPGSYGSF